MVVWVGFANLDLGSIAAILTQSIKLLKVSVSISLNLLTGKQVFHISLNVVRNRRV